MITTGMKYLRLRGTPDQSETPRIFTVLADASFVCEADVLQAVLDAFPSAVDIDVRTVGEYGGGRTDPLAALRDRQREALAAALELGYFGHPRAAIQADVADRLGCASSTASEHLKKAQAALGRAVLGDQRS